MKDKHVIFDLDGTLIDPSVSICRSVNYALEKKGFAPVEHSRIYPYIGKHLIDPFRDITGISEDDRLWEMIHLYRERYETIGIAENDLYPGIRDMIENIGSTNYIASIKPWHASKMILKELGIETYFAGVYGSEVDGTRADKTELLHYLKDVESLDFAVMVGDRNVDIIAAKSCGFASVGVCYGYGGKKEIEEAGPDIIVEKPEDLREAIIKIWKN